MALTHLFRAYDPKSQTAMFDRVLRMGELMPDNLNRAVTQMTYFLPTLKNLHVSDDTAATMMIALSRFGLGRGKGGTSLQNLAADALGPLQMTQHAQAGKAFLLGPHVLNVNDAKGASRFFTDKGGDLFGFLDRLAAYEKKSGSITAQRTFEGAFGKVGSRLADLLADPVMIDQLHKVHDVITQQASLGLNSQSDTIFGTAGFAMKDAAKDFQSLATEIGYTALPGVTRAFGELANGLHEAQHFLHEHKQIEIDIQRDITESVKVAERFITGHHDDWVQLGSDAKRFMDYLPTLASDFTTVGAAVLPIMEEASRWAALFLDSKPEDQLPNLQAAFLGVNDKGKPNDLGLGPLVQWLKDHRPGFPHPPGWAQAQLDRDLHDRGVPWSGDIHVHVVGGKDARKDGQIVGAAVAHHLAKAGLIRNSPQGAGFNSATPAAH
jgi:hypothetical protein